MIDLSNSTDPRIAVASHVLTEVSALARRRGVPLMVIGATARDLLSEAIVGAPPGRATSDVDVAVAVPSWNAFDDFASELPRIGRSRHRFRLSGVEVDVVPFGKLETPQRHVDWGDGTRMSALGLSEVYAAAESAVLPGGLELRVPTVPGLTVLKLSAWSDRRLETRRDATDLRTIIGWYAVGPFLDQLYDVDIELLEAYGYAPAPASAHRLGRDMARLLGDSRDAVTGLLDDVSLGNLAADMPRSVGDQVAVLRALREGLTMGSLR